MENIRSIDPDAIEDSYYPQGGPGKGGPKTKRGEGGVFGSRDRKKNKEDEARKGQQNKAMGRKEHGEKSPVDEVQGVLDYIQKEDGDRVDMPFQAAYIKWLSENINNPEEANFPEDEFGNWEQMTASVHAGGGGRQTSRNARARTHLITGMRANAEESRQGSPNEKIVMGKLTSRLRRHLGNWRILLMADDEKEFSENEITDAVMERIG